MRHAFWLRHVLKGLVCALALLLVGVSSARAEDGCTLIMDAASGALLLQEGWCDQRVTPASTFKLPLAVIGFDAGILQGPDLPVWSFHPGDPEWGGANWRRDTTPRDWLQFSVVWYSQRITRALGAARLQRYLLELGFGNGDMSGDLGQGNGLERAWLSSSLQVSPREQLAFLRALVTGSLPISERAMRQVRATVKMQRVAGWRMQGKTGGAYLQGLDGQFDRRRGVGWYVGWARLGTRQLVFVRMVQFDRALDRSPGIVVRAAVHRDWARLMMQLEL